LLDADAFDATTSRWTEVPLDQLRFGDVLAFRSEAGATLHAAVYLAEDLLFSKDGWSSHRPWELGRIARERAVYHTAPRIVAYRAP
jgi:cell wall-associated NlpC family hydrolase